MSLPAPGIFGCLEREITTAKTSACQTKLNAEPGRPVRKVLIHPVPIVIPLILPALTARIPILPILQAIPVLILTVLIARPLLVRLICLVPVAMIWAALTSTVPWINMLSMAVQQ